MIINHNISAMNTNRQLGLNNNAASKSMEKLASGLRINKAGDDAAGLSISEKMRGQIRGLDQASRNAQDGISLIQTAEGALGETHSILQRMRELSVQSANDSNTIDDRAELQKEVDQLKQEVDRISFNTEFNTKKLLNGDLSAKSYKDESGSISSKTGNFDVQITSATLADGDATIAAIVTSSDTVVMKVDAYDSATDTFSYTLTNESTGVTSTAVDFIAAGSTTDAITNVGGTGVDMTVDSTNIKVGDSFTLVTRMEENLNGGPTQALQFQIGANSNQTLSVSIESMSTEGLGIQNLDVSTQEQSTAAISTLDEAIKNVSSQRSSVGALQNRLDHTISNLSNSAENIQAAESRIRDVDMAKEVMEMTKNNILSQASQAMLAQANQKPQAVLQLLG